MVSDLVKSVVSDHSASSSLWDDTRIRLRVKLDRQGLATHRQDGLLCIYRVCDEQTHQNLRNT